jgi:hypothetical protein
VECDSIISQLLSLVHDKEIARGTQRRARAAVLASRFVCRYLTGAVPVANDRQVKHHRNGKDREALSTVLGQLEPGYAIPRNKSSRTIGCTGSC